MNTAEYWENASLLREIAVQEGATATTTDILRLYNEALDDIEEEIRKIKYNFQNRFGIDNDTAEYFLTQAQQEENLNMLIRALEAAPSDKARKDILEYIHRDGLSVRAYSARIERYEALKESVYARIKNIAVKATPLLEGMLIKAYKESYYGNIDDTAKGLNVGINFAMIDDRAVEEAVNVKWKGARFSERIWKNTDRLAEEAQDLVVKSIVSGESLTKTATKLSETFDVEKFRATTLVRTEVSHAHNQADLKVYEDLDIEEYKYSATLDYRTCELCQPLDGKVFKVSEAREGINFPVMHPRCRCTTTMNMMYNGRRARDPLTGKSGIIDGSVTYEQWYNGLSPEQKQALHMARKKDDNRTADKLQHAKYKKVLGTKEVPRVFDKFQEMKYNDGEKWKFIKLDYNRQERLIKNPSLVLPNAKKATVDDRKFTNYLFDGDNERGLAKGRVFTSRLGYDKNNYSELKDEILSKANKYTATYKDEDEYGVRYEQKMVLRGKNNTPANVVVGWKKKDGKTWMTSAYIKEIGK